VLTVHLLPTGANTSLAARQSSGSWRLLGNTGVPSCACRWSIYLSSQPTDGPHCCERNNSIYVDGNVVVVQLALQGACHDVFELEGGKIKRFDCYPEGSIIFAQLGVLNNLDAALGH
jgi:hypothetical protein